MIDSVMNNEEFLKRLSEVSEWHRPNLGPHGSPSISKGRKQRAIEHPGEITEAELMEMTDEAAQDYYDRLMLWREAQPNASVPPKITKVKIQAKHCEDCNRYCPEGRRVECKLYESGSKHWREFCTTCELYRDPVSKEFTLPKHTAHIMFTAYHRPKLGLYTSKFQPTVKEPKPPKVPKPKGRPKKLTKTQLVEDIMTKGHWEVKETADAVIRVFVPKTP